MREGALEKGRKPKEKKEKDRKISTENAFEACNFGGKLPLKTWNIWYHKKF